MKIRIALIYFTFLLITTSCASIIEAVSPPTPTPTPTPSVFPPTMEVPTPTRAIPTPTPTLMPTLDLKNIDRLDELMPGYSFFPKDCTYIKTSEGITINWRDSEHFFSCGEENGEMVSWRIENAYNAGITSSAGYPIGVRFDQEEYQNWFDESLATNELGHLRLIFDPLSCDFVVTTEQKHLLDQDSHATLQRLTNRTEPYAMQYIMIGTDGRVRASIFFLHRISEDADFWAYKASIPTTEEMTRSFGYKYVETGRSFTWEMEKGDGSPILRVSGGGG